MPALPYIIYFPTDTDVFGADNKVYLKLGTDYTVELYSDAKNATIEATIEALFDSNDLFYEKSETYISGEMLYMVRYSINF